MLAFISILKEWEQKKPDFGSWRRNQEEIPDMMGLKLNSLLITPVQRVPRLVLVIFIAFCLVHTFNHFMFGCHCFSFGMLMVCLGI